MKGLSADTRSLCVTISSAPSAGGAAVPLASYEESSALDDRRSKSSANTIAETTIAVISGCFFTEYPQSIIWYFSRETRRH